MSYGTITRIVEDAPNSFSGTLENLEKKGDILTFSKQPGLEEINKLDVVNYTDSGGAIATNLTPNLKVNQRNLKTATTEVQDLTSQLALAMAKDKNETTISLRKF
jgi:hypothetical protein